MSLAATTAPAAPPQAPLAQLQRLCDPGSFRPLRSGARSARLGARALPGDGVVAGAGVVAGRPV
ncbi:MAG TPA: methylmalonyl-CoA carboxyltransferase, partial [Solirubrobacterales bacterium]|nr:methylmalonyl-CoA carboxyltransferase [Solirubrobacterales bacterium]